MSTVTLCSISQTRVVQSGARLAAPRAQHHQPSPPGGLLRLTHTYDVRNATQCNASVSRDAPGCLVQQFPGEDAPDTGRRRRPPAELRDQPNIHEEFPQRSTEACYQNFPLEVKSSCPLELDPRAKSPQAYLSELKADCGPFTGHRKPPPVESKRTSEHARDEEVLHNKEAVITHHSIL